ncbi:MAG: hypothetical protein CMI53_03300 [Parcubacteria group bacterium]|nr:hypothetical protein [Parcubacteria group bacterium]|tara:strand:- start:6201 stop:8228 length:2028 start_codon:yes stop_codon:yes gene_type:complete
MQNFIKKLPNLDTIQSFLILVYSFFLLNLIFGLAGILNFFTVSLSLFFILLLLFVFRKKIVFDKKVLIFLVLFPASILGVMMLRGFFSGDVTGYWLPYARLVVENNGFVDFAYGTELYHFARMPLLPILSASTFLLLNTFNELTLMWIPFIFGSLTLYLIYKWGEEKGINKTNLAFLVLLFLTNEMVWFWGGWNIMQETLIIFSATCFLYFWEKYQIQKSNFDLLIVILSFVLLILSKMVGLLWGLLLLYMFWKSKNKKRFIIYALLLGTPVILWFIRNYLIYENPVFPLFNDIFKGKYYEIFDASRLFTILDDRLLQPLHRVIYSFRQMFFIYPIIILSFLGFIKNKKWEYLSFNIIYFVATLTIFFSSVSIDRWHYAFFGLWLVYGILYLQQLKSKWFLLGLQLLAIFGILTTAVVDSSSVFISKFETILEPLKFFVDLVANNALTVLIILLPFMAVAIWKNTDRYKLVLLFTYSLYFLKIRFVANKSWVNVWIPILIFLFFVLLVPMLKKVKAAWLMAFIIIILFLNSWGMSFVYYPRHGGFHFPVQHVYYGGVEARKILDQLHPNNKDDFYILTRQTQYLAWHGDYNVARITTFGFNLLTDLEYNDDLTVEELSALFKDKNIKYVLKNNNTYYPREKILWDKLLSDPELFKILGQWNSSDPDEDYYLWQIY